MYAILNYPKVNVCYWKDDVLCKCAECQCFDCPKLLKCSALTAMGSCFQGPKQRLERAELNPTGFTLMLLAQDHVKHVITQPWCVSHCYALGQTTAHHPTWSSCVSRLARESHPTRTAQHGSRGRPSKRSWPRPLGRSGGRTTDDAIRRGHLRPRH